MKCGVCHKEAENRFCPLHRRAHTNVMKKFEIWQKAAEASWEQYLKELMKNKLTGIWVKEVVEYLLKEQE